MKDFAKKLTSRKFLVSIVSIIVGVVLISCGNAEEGVTTIVASVIAYLASEGFIDAMAVSKKTEEIGEAIEEAGNTEEAG